VLATEMDYLRRCRKRTRLNRVPNETLREMMEREKNVIDAVQKRQLLWFGYTNRMDETRWPRNVLEWVPQERRERGQPR
jgi:hypothetical protein